MPLKFLHKPIYQKRISVLSKLINEYVSTGDKLLDMGSGFGELALLIKSKAESDGKVVTVEGIEKFPRGNEVIKTHKFDGYDSKLADNSYEIVVLADVIHHEEDYYKLIEEAKRVCSKYLIIKDHTPNGLLGYQRICFMDWAANNPYGVKCLYRYFTDAEWKEIYDALNLNVLNERKSIKLYQEPFNFIFGNSLQYLAILEV